MRIVILIALALMLPSCATHHPNGGSRWTETCPSCHQQHHYAYSFDDKDYDLILGLMKAFKITDEAVYWKAPHGPGIVCSDNYRKDMPFDYLRSEMPRLRRDTFADFQRRNDPIPAHHLRRWKSSRGEEIAIAFRRRLSGNVLVLSRSGFSRDGRQALIYSDGGSAYLFEKRDGKWVLAGSVVLWIS